MSEFISRTSLILDLTEFVANEQRAPTSVARRDAATRPDFGQPWLAALVVIGAAAGTYHWGMNLLAVWQWQ